MKRFDKRKKNETYCVNKKEYSIAELIELGEKSDVIRLAEQPDDEKDESKKEEKK